MTKHLVRVSSYAHAAAERRRRISASPLPDFHGGTAALRARRPVRPTGPLSVHGAISHLDGWRGKKKEMKINIRAVNDVVIVYTLSCLCYGYTCVGNHNFSASATDYLSAISNTPVPP